MSLPAYILFIPLFHIAVCTAEPAYLTALNKFDHISHPLKQQLIHLLQHVTSEPLANVSQRCQDSLREFARGLQEDDYHAMVMLDSFSKVRAGMITSQGYDYGSYHQCLSHGRYVYFGVTFPIPDEEDGTTYDPDRNRTWQERYSRGMNVGRLHPFTSAVCLPDQCHHPDLQAILSSQGMLDRLRPLEIQILTTESRSDSDSKSLLQIVAMVIIMIQMSACLISSLFNAVDPVHPFSKKVQAFDMVKNSQSLMSDMKESNSHLAGLNLFRVAYLSSAMHFHTLIGMSGVLSHVTDHLVGQEADSMMSKQFRVIPASVPLTAVLSACLSVVTWLPVMRMRPVSFLQFTVMRIMRTLPVIIGFLLLTQTLPLIPFGGPMMKHVQQNTASMCYTNGWSELAFVSNFLPVSQMCNPVTWFVSLDMQLYAASFIIMRLLVSRERTAFLCIIAQMVIGCLASGSFSLYHGIKPVLSFTLRDIAYTVERYALITHHTAHYIALYPIGMIMGYIIVRNGGIKKPVGYPATLILSLTTFSFLTFVASAYDHDLVFKFPGMEFAFSCCVRFIGSALSSFILYALMNTTNDLVITVSKSKLVTVLCRLSFSILVTHVLMIHFVIASFEHLNSSPLIGFMIFTTVTLFSVASGFLMYIFVEAPFHNLLLSMSGTKRARAALEQKSKLN